ncbi:MAG: ABC transporter permease subunit [Gemmatimonadaceae bacterium]
MPMIAKVLRYVLLDVIRNRWVVGYALFFLLVTDALVRFGGSGGHALLGLLNVVVLLIPLVTLVFGTIYWHGAREFNELLLTQPIGRTTLFHGLFAGLVFPLSLAFALGVSLPLLLHRVLDGQTLPLLAMTLVTGVALTGVFGALAVLIGGVVTDRLKGLGIALGVWLFLTVVYDGFVLWVAVAYQDAPIEKLLLALTFANPVDLARVLLIVHFDISAIMGYTGAIVQKMLGGAVGVLAAATALVAWTIVPGLVALRVFRRRDF